MVQPQLKRIEWVFAAVFMYCLHYLSLGNVPLSSAYPCLWVWYAGSLAKANLTEFTLTVVRCLRVCWLGLWVCVRGYRCLSFCATIRLVCVCVIPLVLWLMAVLGELDEALHHYWNKDWEEWKRDTAKENEVYERKMGWDDEALTQ